MLNAPIDYWRAEREESVQEEKWPATGVDPDELQKVGRLIQLSVKSLFTIGGPSPADKRRASINSFRELDPRYRDVFRTMDRVSYGPSKHLLEVNTDFLRYTGPYLPIYNSWGYGRNSVLCCSSYEEKFSTSFPFITRVSLARVAADTSWLR